MVVVRKTQLVARLPRFADGKTRELANRAAAHSHPVRLGTQPRTVARRADDLASKRFEPFAAFVVGRRGQLLLERLGEVAIGPVEPAADGPCRPAFQRSRAIEPIRGEKRRGRVGDAFRQTLLVAVGGERASVQRTGRFGKQQFGIELFPQPQSLAGRTGAIRAVETECPRFQLVVADLARRAGVAGAEKLVAPRVVRRWLAAGARRWRGGAALLMAGDQHAFAMLDGEPQGFGESRFGVGLDDDSIHNRFDRMVLARIERREAFDVAQLAVDPHANETGFANRFEDRLMLALAASNHRGEQHQTRAFREADQPLLNLLGRLLADRLAALMAFRLAEPRIKQAEEIVDLGRGGDSAARVAGPDPLIDADCRRQPVQTVDVGPFERMKELAGVDRQRFQILPLALRVQRVEGEAALARAAGAREHDEPIAGNVDVDVLEIVNAGAPQSNHVVVCRRGGCAACGCAACGCAGGGFTWGHKWMAGSGGCR